MVLYLPSSPNCCFCTWEAEIPYSVKEGQRYINLNPSRLLGWEINVPFNIKIGYIGDKVPGGDLVPPG